MTPDFLVDCKVVMGALGITTEVEFRKMLKEGLIPPAVGQLEDSSLVQFDCADFSEVCTRTRGEGIS